MRSLLIALLLLIFARSICAQHTVSYSDNLFRYDLKVDSVLTPDKVNYDCVIRTIRIYSKTDSRLVQVINAPDNTPPCGMPPDQVFIIQDMNFDGFNDFRLLQFLPAGPNEPYFYWMFDPKTGLFKRDTTLEDITAPAFDTVRKEVVSSWRGGMGDYGSSTYKYIDGKITLVEENESKDDGKYVRFTEKKRIKGKMKIVKREKQKSENGNTEN